MASSARTVTALPRSCCGLASPAKLTYQHHRQHRQQQQQRNLFTAASAPHAPCAVQSDIDVPPSRPRYLQPLPAPPPPSSAFPSLPLPSPYVPILRQWMPPLPRPHSRLQQARLCLDLDATSGLLRYENPLQEKKNSDPNKANLGRTLRILQERLPTLLQSPLPQDILSPAISLHLFPSTHPHLPVVSGRVAYNAALWTSPIAWNRVPLVGNVRVEVVSERMSRGPLPFGGPLRAGAVSEQLVVRWRTCGKGHGDDDDGSTSDGGSWKEKNVPAGVGGSSASGGGDAEFTGLFIFQFDGEGRILSHTIEHAQTGEGWDKGVGARVVGLTDWLLGGIRGRPIADG